MTSKRARHVSGKGAVWHMFSEQATLAKMPKYNGATPAATVLTATRNTIAQNRNVLGKRRCKRRSLSGLLPDCGICSAGSLRL